MIRPAAPKPRSILVTGAGGFVGRHLLDELRRCFPGAVSPVPAST